MESARGQHFTSYDYFVRPGEEEAFIALWSDIAARGFEDLRSSRSWSLLRCDGGSNHFRSVVRWSSAEHLGSFLKRPETAAFFLRAADLCDRIERRPYTLVASSGGC